jgi:uncharacterized Tic20 family protein
MEIALTKNERDWAMYANLAGLLFLTGLPFAHILGPLVIYLKVCGESAFAAAIARASLNFQITQTLWALVLVTAGAIVFSMAGLASAGSRHGQVSTPILIAGLTFFVVLIPLGIVNIASCIRGAIAAAKTEPFNYPFAIEFVR